MRAITLFFIGLFWVSFAIHGQYKQVLYDFVEIPQAAMVNPGVLTDFQLYSGIPVVSGIYVQGGSSGISVNDLFANDGLDINDKIRDRAISAMNPRDEINSTFQLELLNFGFRGRNPDNFYTAGIYILGDAITYWPQDFAILAFEGNVDRLNQRFDLGDLKARGEMVNVFHFGLNKKVDNDLTVGLRGKLYSSMLDFNSTKNKGFFVTREGQNNSFENTLNADMRSRSSGFNEIQNAADDGTLPGVLAKRAFFGGNLGLGVDLGFTYQLNKQMILTGSLLDLGFIYHTNDVFNYTLKGNTTVEGIEAILPDEISNPDTGFWEKFLDEVPVEDDRKNYVAFLPTKLYASLRYNFGKPFESRANCECGVNTSSNSIRSKYTNSLGGQLFMVNRPRGPQAALTAFYQRRFGNSMAIKATYTVDKFSYTNLGLGLNLQAGYVNFYVMADNLLSYRNIAASRYASFQLGLNIISWGKK